EERGAIKAEIIALLRSVEQELTDLAALREEIKVLVDRWKRIPGTSRPATPPQVEGMKPVMGDPPGASTYVEKGWSLISLGDHEGAERALARALELAPNDPQAESLLGRAQRVQQEYDDALLTFQKVLMHEPSNALARVNLGYICLKKRIFGEAIEHLSRAIRIDNERKAFLYAHFYLGLVYAEREMYGDAQSFFRRTLALGPNLIEAWYELGRALWFDGQPDAARQAWRDGLNANKLYPWGKRCGEMLELVEAGGAPARDA